MDPRPRAAADETTQAVPVGRPVAAHPFLSPPELPDEIGRLGTFRILDELGHGGMGVVFRAEEVGLKRLVALKVMLPTAATSPGAKARFLREAEAQAKVEHDHIIAIHRVDEANGVPFLAMPLLKGQTLSSALKQSRHPPVAEVVRVGAEMADGLAAAHAAGLIHRDIKPANVWLEGAKRRVKILDFGLARVAHAPAETGEPTAAPPLSETNPDSAQLTAAGAVMGTPAYMSPEQARGLTDQLGPATDLFSLGVVLYEMATGKKPFVGPSSVDVMAAVVTHHPPAAHELNPDVPLPLSELIWRLMAKDLAQRPASAATVAEELEALGRGLAPLPVQVYAVSEVPGEPNPWADLADTEAGSAVSGPSAAVPSVAAPAPPKTSRKPLLLAGAAVLVAGAVVAAVVVAMTRPKPPRDPDPTPVVEVPKKDGPAAKPKDAGSGTAPSAFFNGKDFSGWKVSGNRGVWEANNGTITWSYQESGTMPYSYLTSDRAFGDFELSFQFRHTGERLNPLGFLLTFRAEEGTKGTHHLNFQTTNALFKISKVKVASVDGLYRVRLRCVGKKVTAVVNGETLVDEEIDMPSRGAFIWHNVSSFKGAVAISDIKFTELPRPTGDTFFNGTDLTGWTGAGVRHWKVVDGALVSDSPAYALQSERTYSDFELSFRAKLPHPQQGTLGLGIRLNKVADDGKGGSLSFVPDGVRFSQKKGTLWPTNPGEFNDVTLRCVGKRVKVIVNGSVTLDEECDIPVEGLFSLRGVSGLGSVVIKDIQFTDLSKPAKK